MFRRKDYTIGDDRERHVKALRRSLKSESATGLQDLHAEALTRQADWRMIEEMVSAEIASRERAAARKNLSY